MAEHITAAQWSLYFSGEMTPRERLEMQNGILAHTAECPSCREFYEKAQALQQAARAYAAPRRYAADEGAYRAVASPAPGRGAPKKSGRIAVGIDVRANDAFFMQETLETEGIGNKYALNAENGARELSDDEGALTAGIKGGVLSFHFSDGNVRASARLITDEEAVPLPEGEEDASAPLPDENFCVLEITLTEA